MGMMTYHPWSLMDQVFNEMTRRRDAQVEEASEARAWTPAVNVREEESRFVVEADIPGVDPKDIEISVDKGVLSVKGERVVKSEDEQGGYKRRECRFGGFYRQFTLPEDVDAEAISASGSHGVLSISLPKKAAQQPRRITVNS